MPGWIDKIKTRMVRVFRRPKKWEEIEYFDKAWEDRVSLMAGFITPGESVLDLGCGEMTLKKIRPDILYYPVDYTQRAENTIICDFNQKQFPETNADSCFVSGVMEYIKDPSWFINKICSHCRKVIISYCSTDFFPDMNERKRNYWVNHFSSEQLISFFSEHHFNLRESTETKTHNQVFVFEKK